MLTATANPPTVREDRAQAHRRRGDADQRAVAAVRTEPSQDPPGHEVTEHESAIGTAARKRQVDEAQRHESEPEDDLEQQRTPDTRIQRMFIRGPVLRS